jgi:Site-specific recombinase XerD
LRNRAVIAVLFGSGLRRSEALALDIGAVKVSPEGVVFLELLTSKSGKRQARTLAKFAWKYLSSYISQRKAEGGQNVDPLFVWYYANGKPRGRLSQGSFYRIFRDSCRQIGIKAAPHAARATFATRLHQVTGSDLLTADALGHQTTAQVRKYVKDRDRTNMTKISALDYDS